MCNILCLWMQSPKLSYNIYIYTYLYIYYMCILFFCACVRVMFVFVWRISSSTCNCVKLCAKPNSWQQGFLSLLHNLGKSCWFVVDDDSIVASELSGALCRWEKYNNCNLWQLIKCALWDGKETELFQVKSRLGCHSFLRLITMLLSIS